MREARGAATLPPFTYRTFGTAHIAATTVLGIAEQIGGAMAFGVTGGEGGIADTGAGDADFACTTAPFAGTAVVGIVGQLDTVTVAAGCGSAAIAVAALQIAFAMDIGAGITRLDVGLSCNGVIRFTDAIHASVVRGTSLARRGGGWRCCRNLRRRELACREGARRRRHGWGWRGGSWRSGSRLSWGGRRFSEVGCETSC